MNFALLVPRAPHLKILGPVAAEALRRGHRVSAVVTPADVKGAGALAHADRELGPLGIPVGSQMALVNGAFDWCLAVGTRTAPDLRRRTRPRTRWAALDHAGDNLSFFLESPTRPGPYSDWDVTVPGSYREWDWDMATTLSHEAAAFASRLKQWPHRFIPIGYPELDQLSTVIGDRAACRAKWNLPAGQFIVFFGPAARPIRLGRICRWWFGLIRYRQIIRVLRAWCDVHGALLVAKTRAKHGDPAWLARYCDRIVGDQSFYPFTTLELLRAADLYVGFASALAIEACAVGLPQVHLHGWSPETAEWPSGWPFKQEFFIKPGGLWNYPGAKVVKGYARGWKADLHVDLHNVTRGQSDDANAMRAACERWAGPLDGQASARVLDALERHR